MIYLGLESGNEQVLKHINKGVTVEDIVRAGQMVKDAGMKLSVTAISGLGGTEMWKEHAIDTAKAFSRMKPDYIAFLARPCASRFAQRWSAAATKKNISAPCDEIRRNPKLPDSCCGNRRKSGILCVVFVSITIC